jgi:hypothetical protein
MVHLQHTDRLAHALPAAAGTPSGDSIRPLDVHVVVDPPQKAARDAYLAALATFADGGCQRHRARPHVTEQWVIVSRQVARQKARRLLEPQAGRREEFSEESIALAVLAPPRWIDSAVKEMCAKTDIAKQDEPVHADEPHVVPPGRRLPERSGPPPCMPRGRRRDSTTTGERGGYDQLLLPCPTIKLLECRHRAVPGRSGDLARSIGEPACAMECDDVLAVGVPHALAAAAFGEETNPGQNIVGIGSNAVGRTHAHAWTLAKKAIELNVVGPIVAENEWDTVHEPGQHPADQRIANAPACLIGAVEDGGFGEVEL